MKFKIDHYQYSATKASHTITVVEGHKLPDNYDTWEEFYADFSQQFNRLEGETDKKVTIGGVDLIVTSTYRDPAPEAGSQPDEIDYEEIEA